VIPVRIHRQVERVGPRTAHYVVPLRGISLAVPPSWLIAYPFIEIDHRLPALKRHSGGARPQVRDPADMELPTG
jgi:hypothetical protein